MFNKSEASGRGKKLRSYLMLHTEMNNFQESWFLGRKKSWFGFGFIVFDFVEKRFGCDLHYFAGSECGCSVRTYGNNVGAQDLRVWSAFSSNFQRRSPSCGWLSAPCPFHARPEVRRNFLAAASVLRLSFFASTRSAIEELSGKRVDDSLSKVLAYADASVRVLFGWLASFDEGWAGCVCVRANDVSLDDVAVYVICGSGSRSGSSITI